MVVRDQDPDVIRWGLHHLFQGQGAAAAADYCSAHHPQTATTDYAQTEHPVHHGDGDGDGDWDSPVGIKIDRITQNDAVENDEIIAHALQEELSQIAVAEASGTSHADEQHSAVLTQQWFRPSIIHVASGIFIYSFWYSTIKIQTIGSFQTLS